ncbi:chalcone isomerase family protein [Thiomonas sp. FB-Cd]|uniref:chalcone isomerase family protein n=1 Tax=Thiomonas sp. FB-Cd TaxID=1158292 RepID=UPI00068CFEB0|nr:chalcone isomerase family protein [Thiomonas sp. FB-Cd]
MKKIMLAAALATSFATMNANAAIKVGGVSVEQSSPANGTPLWINGAGVISLAGQRMAAALYVPENSTSDSAIMTASPKELRLIPMKAVGGAQLGQAIDALVKKSVSAAQYKQYEPDLAKVKDMFKSVKTIPAGQTVSLRSFGKQGTYIMVPGGLKMAPLGGAELFDSLARALPHAVINSAAVQKQNHPSADCLGCAKPAKAL